MARDRYEDDEDDDFAYGKPDRPTPGVCPACGARRSTKVSFTWWGGALGPGLFSQVKCSECGQNYNRKTGKPIGALVITVYTLVAVVIVAAILAAIYG